jgi:ribosomal protein S27AE
MRRTDTEAGAKFRVRGQTYIQSGHFYYEMESGHEVRILELDTDCPECGASFVVTASLRQIEHRILNRRCERCRKIHRGPVDVGKIKERKAKKEARGRVRRRQTTALPPPGKSPPTKLAAPPAGAVSSAPERQLPAPTATAPATPATVLEDLDAYRRALGMMA